MSSNQSNHKKIEPIRIEKTNPMQIAGLNKYCTFENGLAEAPALWQEFSTYAGNIPGQKGSAAYGLCIETEEGKEIEYVAGVEVSMAEKLPEKFITKKLPALTCAVFSHDGHVSKIPETCDAIWKDWIPKSGAKKPEHADFFFERYGEKFDPQKGIGDIEIWVPIEI